MSGSTSLLERERNRYYLVFVERQGKSSLKGEGLMASVLGVEGEKRVGNCTGAIDWRLKLEN